MKLFLLLGILLGTTKARINAPNFALQSISGDTVKLSEFKGRIVILDFWATWCPPCKKEIPGYIRLKNTYPDSVLEIIGVTLERNIGKVIDFKERVGVNYPLVMPNRAILQEYGNIQAIPTTFVIDRKGRIYRRYVGYVPLAEFRMDIERLIREKE